MTTRRDFVRGAAAAVPAAALAGVPAIASPDPDERLRLAVQEMKDAMEAKWPGYAEAIEWPGWSGRGTGKPCIVFIAQPPGTPCA